MESGPPGATLGRLMRITTHRGCLVLAVAGELDLGTETGFVEAVRQSLRLLSLLRTVEDAIEGAGTPPAHAPARDEHGSAAAITDPA